MATLKYDLDLVLQILSHVLPTLIYTIEYGTYYFNAEKVSYTSFVFYFARDL